MDPNQTCEILLSNLKQSNLNFSLYESPFTMTINIKKSFIKDHYGVSRTSGFSDKNFETTEVNNTLKNIISHQTNEIFNYQHALQELSINLEKSKCELTEVLAEKKQIKFAKETFAKEIAVKDDEILYLNKKLQQISTLDSLQSSSSTFLSTPSLIFSNPSLELADSSSSFTKSSSNSFSAADINHNLPLYNTPESCANLLTPPANPQPSVPAPCSRPTSTPTRQPSTATKPLQSPVSTSTSSVVPILTLSPASTACTESTPSGPPTPKTPPAFNLCQMSISFRNFLSDFKDENNEQKYVKQAREMISYNRNVMHISIGDLERYNQHLSEIIRADYMGLVSSFHSDLKAFMEENVEQTFGQEFYLSINLKHD